MVTVGWLIVPLVLLVAFVVLVVAVRPQASKPIVQVLRSLEGVIAAIVPWGRSRTTSSGATDEV